jgi:hypothetical protein
MLQRAGTKGTSLIEFLDPLSLHRYFGTIFSSVSCLTAHSNSLEFLAFENPVMKSDRESEQPNAWTVVNCRAADTYLLPQAFGVSPWKSQLS